MPQTNGLLSHFMSFKNPLAIYNLILNEDADNYNSQSNRKYFVLLSLSVIKAFFVDSLNFQTSALAFHSGIIKEIASFTYCI